MLHTTFAILILVKMYGLHLMIILMFYYPLIRFYHSSTLPYSIPFIRLQIMSHGIVRRLCRYNSRKLDSLYISYK